MAENNEDNSNPRKSDNSFKSEQEKAQWRKKALEEYKQQLENDERFKEYAEQFSGHSVASFIEDFARQKVWWVEWGDKYEQWKEDEAVKWQERAWERLKDIQQKKLFDLQCEWRAEKIELRGVKICFDFMVEAYDIFSCSLIDPIEENEFDLYMQFVASGDFEPLKEGQAQNYEMLKEAHESEDEYGGHYPEWYAFADSRRGTGFYISLPDIRGDKERFYISLADGKPKEQKPVAAANEAAAKVEQKPRPKPQLNYFQGDFMKWFITTYDTAETLKYYEAFADTTKASDENIEESINLLTSSRMILPIKESRNWKEGIMRTSLELYRRKMLEALPIAYEQYRMKTDNGIPAGDGPGFFCMMNTMQRQIQLEKILRGRELNGEGRDLRF